MHDGACVFSSVSQNWPTAEPSLQETGLHCPADHSRRAVRGLVDLSVRTAQAFGLRRGVLHVEGKCTSRGPRIVEVNTRMGGGRIHEIVEAVWGVDLVEAQLRSSLDLAQALTPSRRPRCAVVNAIVHAPASGRLEALPVGDVPADEASNVAVDLEVEVGAEVLGPERTFATPLVEVTVERQEPAPRPGSVQRGVEPAAARGAAPALAEAVRGRHRPLLEVACDGTRMAGRGGGCAGRRAPDRRLPRLVGQGRTARRGDPATVGRLIDEPNTEYLLAAPAEGERAGGVCQLRYRLSVWSGLGDCWLEDLYVDGARAGPGSGGRSSRSPSSGRGRVTATGRARRERAEHGRARLLRSARLRARAEAARPDAVHRSEALRRAVRPRRRAAGRRRRGCPRRRR